MLQKRNAVTSITKSRLRESSMMTRKDYIKIAKLFKDASASSEIIEGFIIIAKEDNPRFDIVKFRAAAMDWT